VHYHGLLRYVQKLYEIALYVICGQTIIEQDTMDQSVRDRLEKISHVYAFLIEPCTLEKVTQIKEPLSKISKLMPKCVNFIQKYSKIKSFCMSYSHLSFNVWLMPLHEGVRTEKHVGDETNTVITTYGHMLDVLTQQCQDLISWDTWATVQELDDKADHISANVGNICDVIGDIHKDVEHVHIGVKDIQQEVWHVLNGVCCVKDAIGHVQNGIDEIENKLSKMGKDGSTQL